METLLLCLILYTILLHTPQVYSIKGRQLWLMQMRMNLKWLFQNSRNIWRGPRSNAVPKSFAKSSNTVSATQVWPHLLSHRSKVPQESTVEGSWYIQRDKTVFWRALSAISCSIFYRQQGNRQNKPHHHGHRTKVTVHPLPRSPTPYHSSTMIEHDRR